MPCRFNAERHDGRLGPSVCMVVGVRARIGKDANMGGPTTNAAETKPIMGNGCAVPSCFRVDHPTALLSDGAAT